QFRDRREGFCVGERQCRAPAERPVCLRRPDAGEVLSLGREFSRIAVYRRRVERRRERHYARSGDPISPATGYRSDSLERITGGQIHPSGNIWLTNNWKLDANPFLNPFGNAIVIAIGAAGPVKTPLI